MMKRRVVVTGLGAVTPIGNTVEDFWAGIKEGKVGIGPITKFDTSDYKVKIAAEVKDFVAKERMVFKRPREWNVISQYACSPRQKKPMRIQVLILKKKILSAPASLSDPESEVCSRRNPAVKKISTKGPGKVNPLMVPLMISNMAAGNVSIQLGFRGKMYECGDSLCFRYKLYW